MSWLFLFERWEGNTLALFRQVELHVALAIVQLLNHRFDPCIISKSSNQLLARLIEQCLHGGALKGNHPLPMRMFLDALASLVFNFSVSQSVSDSYFWRSSVNTVSTVSSVSTVSTVNTINAVNTVNTVSKRSQPSQHRQSTESTQSTQSTHSVNSQQSHAVNTVNTVNTVNKLNSVNTANKVNTVNTVNTVNKLRNDLPPSPLP